MVEKVLKRDFSKEHFDARLDQLKIKIDEYHRSRESAALQRALELKHRLDAELWERQAGVKLVAIADEMDLWFGSNTGQTLRILAAAKSLADLNEAQDATADGCTVGRR